MPSWEGPGGPRGKQVHTTTRIFCSRSSSSYKDWTLFYFVTLHVNECSQSPCLMIWLMKHLCKQSQAQLKCDMNIVFHHVTVWLLGMWQSATSFAMNRPVSGDAKCFSLVSDAKRVWGCQPGSDLVRGYPEHVWYELRCHTNIPPPARHWCITQSSSPSIF